MKTLLALLVTLTALTGCATQPLPPPPSIDQIVQMSKDKLPPEDIIRRIRESRTYYPLSAGEIADLRARGVSDVVLDYMLNARIAAERDEEYFRARQDAFFYGGPWGWGYGYGGYGGGIGIGIGTHWHRH